MFVQPLPLPPGFPVFGLPDSFGGFRWLALWQRQFGPPEGEIREVVLGHGHPDKGRWITVTTVLKTPERDVGDGGSIGAIGLEYTAQNAAMGMVDAIEPAEPFDPNRASRPPSAAYRASIDSELARVVETDGVVDLIGWEPTTVSIDGIVHAAHVRRLESTWALVVELPDLVIGASGPSAMASEQWELTDVTGRLGEYAAGDGSQSQPGAS